MDPPFVRLEVLVQALAEALTPHLDIPFACFGHSMGTLISFELARELRRQERRGPVCLFVSGHRAPHLPDPNPPIHHLSDVLFIRELRRLKGTPEEVLEHVELRQLLLPVLRADFALCETYTYSVEGPLDCPIAVFGGLQDERVSRPELVAWREHTRVAYTLRMFPGDHFYLHGGRSSLLDAISHDLMERLREVTR
jgi:medium-chain acyl-[acyl-carrier-protein] hydrolase